MRETDGETKGESPGIDRRTTERGSRNGPPKERGGPSPMELSSMPLDPIYAWDIVLEPVEVMIERTSDFVAQLAEEQLERGEPFTDEELESRFLAFFDRLVEEGTLRRMPDAAPEMGHRILGPGRWLRAQRIRMQRLIAYWREEDGSRHTSPGEGEEGEAG